MSFGHSGRTANGSKKDGIGKAGLGVGPTKMTPFC